MASIMYSGYTGWRRDMQRMELCGRCAELMRDRHLVKVVSRGINHKITCENCKCRRYGGTYDVEPKRAKKADT